MQSLARDREAAVDGWKEFDTGVVTHSVSHYLAAIADLTEQHGYARVVDIARHLNITRGSVSLGLKPLKKRGLVLADRNRHLMLSDEGKQIVEQIRSRRRIVTAFFEDVLGVDAEQADIDACKIEHLLSDEVCSRLDRFIDKHGHQETGARQTANPS